MYSSFKTNSVNKVKPGSIVWGSCRTFDLVAPLLNVLLGHYLYDETGKLDEIKGLYKCIPEDAYNDDTHPFWTSDECYEFLQEIFDEMNEIAPEGHYFGAHEGDGADYGYWVIPER